MYSYWMLKSVFLALNVRFVGLSGGGGGRLFVCLFVLFFRMEDTYEMYPYWLLSYSFLLSNSTF